MSNFHELPSDLNSKGEYMRGDKNPREIEEQPARKTSKELLQEWREEMEEAE